MRLLGIITIHMSVNLVLYYLKERNYKSIIIISLLLSNSCECVRKCANIVPRVRSSSTRGVTESRGVNEILPAKIISAIKYYEALNYS